MVLGSKSLRKAKDKIQATMAQTVTVKLVHGRDVYETQLPCFSTFGQLKVIRAKQDCPSCTLAVHLDFTDLKHMLVINLQFHQKILRDNHYVSFF